MIYEQLPQLNHLVLSKIEPKSWYRYINWLSITRSCARDITKVETQNSLSFIDKDYTDFWYVFYLLLQGYSFCIEGWRSEICVRFWLALLGLYVHPFTMVTMVLDNILC